MSDLLSWAAGLLIAVGLFFMVIAAVGFVRLPDLFSRFHVTGILDTLGAPLVLLGIAVQLGPSLTSGKILLAVIFLYLTSPLVGHLLARSAIEAGYRPRLVEDQSRTRDLNLASATRDMGEERQPKEDGSS